MKAFYKAIEHKIKESGYDKEISGEEIYDDICEEIEDKENGSYLFMCKKTDTMYLEYKIDILDDQFNLGYIIIHDQDKDIKVDFD